MRHGEQNNSIFFDKKCSAFIFSSTVALRCTHTAAFGENNKNGTSWFRVPKREHRNSNTRVPKDEYRVKCLMNMGKSISALFFPGLLFRDSDLEQNGKTFTWQHTHPRDIVQF